LAAANAPKPGAAAAGEFSALFVSSNRGKRSLALDLKRPDLAEDPRFNTPGGRAVNATERILLMAEVIKERPTSGWLKRLDVNDVPSAPVLRRNEVIANEQVMARELILELDHPDIGRIRQPVPAARFDRTPVRIHGPAPRIGEHSAAILAELGFGTAEIEQLATEKIVRLVKP
jgi:crotonobetainyl-CoA:carnitine CoA-transferase CaiB-like acyl-CoA transferase